MQLKNGKFCPLIKEDCVELKCAFFCKITGQNPNTGEHIDEYACSIQWMPILMIENSQMQRQTGAAVESFRNEMVTANQASQQILLAAANLNAPIGLIDQKD